MGAGPEYKTVRMRDGNERRLTRRPGIKTDIVVVGSGAAGLRAGELFVRQGYDVTIVELSPTISNGATVRNEGRLLTGSYHAVAIDDPDEARRVTESTLRSYDQTLRDFSEIVEEPGIPTFALFESPDLAHTAVVRWGAFGVPHKEIPVWQLKKQVPQVRRAPIAAAFEVDDRSINTRRYVRSLLETFENRGGRVLTNTLFVPDGPNTADLETFDEVRQIEAQAFIITAGTGIKDIMEFATGENFPMRFWKSHLMVTERMAVPNLFYIDAGNSGIMNHGSTSVFGLNRDALQVEDPDDYSKVPEKVDLLMGAARRLFPDASFDTYYAYACLKVDITNYSDDLQSLGITIGNADSLPNYIYAIPGKMSSAPILAERLLHYLHQRSINVPTPTREHSFTPDEEPPHTVYRIHDRPLDVFTRVLPEWRRRQEGAAARTDTA